MDLPESMQRAMAKQAEAEREKRAKVIHAEGEAQAAQRLSDAAAIINSQPATLQLRYLQTLTEIATEKNSTIIFPLPIDMLRPFFDMTRRRKASRALPRYFEIIITGRQLAALVAGVALPSRWRSVSASACACCSPAGPHEGIAAVAGRPPCGSLRRRAIAHRWLPPPAASTPAPIPTADPGARPRPSARGAAPTVAAAAEGGTRALGAGGGVSGSASRRRVSATGWSPSGTRPRQVLVQPAAGGKFRVRVGPFPDVESAGRVAARLRAEGFGGAFVVNE